MVTKIARLGIKRDNNFMYYIKDGAVWASPRKKPGQTAKGQKKKIAQFADKGQMDYSQNLYYIDSDGDVVGSSRKGRVAKKPVKPSVKASVARAVVSAPAKSARKLVSKALPAKAVQKPPSVAEMFAAMELKRALRKR